MSVIIITKISIKILYIQAFVNICNKLFWCLLIIFYSHYFSQFFTHIFHIFHFIHNSLKLNTLSYSYHFSSDFLIYNREVYKYTRVAVDTSHDIQSLWCVLNNVTRVNENWDLANYQQGSSEWASWVASGWKNPKDWSSRSMWVMQLVLFYQFNDQNTFY